MSSHNLLGVCIHMGIQINYNMLVKVSPGFDINNCSNSRYKATFYRNILYITDIFPRLKNLKHCLFHTKCHAIISN